MGRIKNYQYKKILVDHLDGDLGNIFNGEIIYPRQLEVHLPSDRKEACNFHCSHCKGGK